MGGITLDILVSATLISMVIFVFSLLLSVLAIHNKSPQLLKKLDDAVYSSNWPLFKPGKYDPGRIGLAFVFYFLLAPSSKMKKISNSLFLLHLISKMTLVLSILLVIIFFINLICSG